MKVLKFYAVAVMIFVHAHLFLISKDGLATDQTSPLFLLTQQFSFLALFITFLPILAGFNFRLENNFNLKKNIKVAIWLFILGGLFNIFVFGFKNIFAWNIYS